MCRRGEIYYVDFGVKNGSCEQGGIRPAVVVSNNKANANAPVITVVPLTTKIWKKPQQYGDRIADCDNQGKTDKYFSQCGTKV